MPAAAFNFCAPLIAQHLLPAAAFQFCMHCHIAETLRHSKISAFCVQKQAEGVFYKTNAQIQNFFKVLQIINNLHKNIICNVSKYVI